MPHENFVSTDWLAAHLGEPGLGIIDASWHLPPTGRNGAAEFRLEHIPGAVFFDIDVIADKTAGLPHMLPDALTFAQEMSALGLGDGMRFVVYDALGLFAAARVWWMLRAFGVADVKILDGGLPKWIREGRPLEQGEAHPQFRALHPSPRPQRSSPRSTTCARRWRTARPRSSTRARPIVSRAARPSRAPACAAATCPAASTCRSSTSSSTDI